VSVHHKRPLFAFFLVTIVCGVVIGHTIKSQAYVGLMAPLGGPATVVAGQAFRPATAGEAAADAQPARSPNLVRDRTLRQASGHRVVRRERVRPGDHRGVRSSEASDGRLQAPRGLSPAGTPARATPRPRALVAGAGSWLRSDHKGHSGRAAGRGVHDPQQAPDWRARR